MRNNKLKGITLLELIIVMTIFSGLMIGAVSLIGMVQNLYITAKEFESVNADLDNVSRYIENNLKYADKVNVYTGYSSLSELLNSPSAAKLPKVQLQSGTDNTYENIMEDNKPLDFFRKYYFNEMKNKYTETYIMEISNAPLYFDINGNPSGSMGNVKIYSADLKNDTCTMISESNCEYYKEFSYNFNLGTPDASGNFSGFNSDNGIISVDIFKNDFSDTDNDGKYFKKIKDDNTSAPYAYLSFSFVNIAICPEIAVIDDAAGIERKAMRYKYFDSGRSSDNIYFIYTLPEILE